VPLFSRLNSCVPTASNLYLANSMVAAGSDSDLYRSLMFHLPNLTSLFHCLDCTEGSDQIRGTCTWFVTRSIFNSEELLAPHPTHKQEHQNLSAVRDFLFNISLVTLHFGDRSSIRNLRMRPIVVTGTHLSLRHGTTFRCVSWQTTLIVQQQLDVVTIFLNPLLIHITLLCLALI
jgi:hypothetical protein